MAAPGPLVEPRALEAVLGDPDLLVVDLGNADAHWRAHVPGAVQLPYASLVAARPPVGGLLPDDESLSATLSAVGLRAGHHVVACDDEGGGRAGRLLWTLAVLGHGPTSLLDGGMRAWAAGGHPMEAGPVEAEPTHYAARAGEAARVDKAWLLDRLGSPDLALLDTRSAAEFAGTDVRAARGGHIPGAVNFDWGRAMDRERHLRLRPREDLLAELAAIGVTPEREVVAYCQTHHRSSHTFCVLRWLGFERVRGYPGAWSDWGNDPDMPVET